MQSFILSVTTLTAISVVAMAEPVRSGRAQTEWLSDTFGYTAGEPLVTALKMTLDKGWHTYWINPGEGGMPLSAEFTLPEGWKVEPPQHPFPVRFKTGELSDFGYEGTVLFPIILHPPAGSQGDVELKATFSWLACNDAACVPGDASLALTLNHAETNPTPAAAEIEESMRRIPTLAPDGWKLDVTESDDALHLRLFLPAPHDHNQLDVFPLTQNVIHPASTFIWQPARQGFTARVTKSPFAPANIESLELVVNAPSLASPVKIGWLAK